jgi:predicted ATP-grasp superfamily ATP-dependent carboligase
LRILVHEWVTGGGLAGSPLPASWAAEGRAMRRAIAADFAALPGGGARVIVTLDSRLPDDPGPWTIERIAPDQATDRVRELAGMADFTVLVAPETTGILARLTREFQASRARVLGSSPEAIDLTGNKDRLAHWLEEHGIPTPRSRTIIPAMGLPADAEYPAVLKPIDGAGSVDTYYLSDARSLPASACKLTVALLQPYVPGVPMSASFMVDDRARAWLVGIGIQRVAVRAGRFEYRGGSIPSSCRSAEPRLRPMLESIPGLRGFVGVDFLWDAGQGQATVLEINPRPTTSCVGLARLLPPGRLADVWLAAFDCDPAKVAALSGLAEWVHGRTPLSFDASGRVVLDRGVVR